METTKAVKIQDQEELAGETQTPSGVPSRKMQTRHVADISLICAVVLFMLVTLVLVLQNYVQAFTVLPKLWLVAVQLVLVTATIGAIADWYGITSIYGRPLRIRYRTKIITEQRTELFGGLSNFFSKRVLNTTSIKTAINKVNLTMKLHKVLTTEKGSVYLVNFLTEVVWIAIQNLDHDEIEQELDNLIRSFIPKLGVTKQLATFLQKIKDDGMHLYLIDRLAQELPALAQSEALTSLIERIGSDAAAKYTSSGSTIAKFLRGFFEGTTRTKFIQGLQEQVSNQLHAIAGDPQHPIKKAATKELENFIKKLKDNPEIWDAKILQLLEGANLANKAMNFLQTLPSFNDKEKLHAALTGLTDKALEVVAKDKEWQETINSLLGRLIGEMLEKNQSYMLDLMNDSINKLSDEELIKYTRDATESEFQSIRLNGMVWGIVVGVVVVIVRINLGLL